MDDPALELIDVSKNFGATRAVDRVSAAFAKRTITALLGENGAGKTTLMRIAAGFLQPDRGLVRIGARDSRLSGARDRQVAMVHQHFVLASELSVAENIALADPDLPHITSRADLRARAEAAVSRCGVRLDRLERRVSELSVGEKAKVELTKALLRNPRVLILDEPTSVLSPPEVDELSRVLRQRADEGAAVILITHKLPEVFALADEIALMRAGRMILRGKVASMTRTSVARAMSNLEPSDHREIRRDRRGEILLELRDVATAGVAHRVQLRALNFAVRQFEIVAIAGAAGNGQDELAEVLRGLVPHSGEVLVDGRAVSRTDLASANGIGHIPADRTAAGVVAGLSVAENLALKNGSTGSRSTALAESAVASFAIVASSTRQDAGTLSGGNQQKVVVARELAGSPELVVAAEPTRGLDVESASSIRRRLADFAARGGAVLLITTDLDEASEIADAVRVIYRGRLSEALPPDDVDSISRLLAGVD